MERKLNSPAKAAIWFIVGNFIAKGIGFISLPIFTRMMNASEYGIASIFLTYEQIILIFGTFEMYLGTYQRGLFKYRKTEDDYSGFTVLLMNCITVIAFLILAINYHMLFRYTKITVLVLLSMFIRTFFQPAYECWLVRKRIAYDYKYAVIANIMLAILNIIVPIVAMRSICSNAEIRIASGLFATSVFSIFFWGFEIRKIKKINISQIYDYFKFNMHMALPNVPHALSFLILANADRIMIEKMVGETEVAYYSVAYAIGSVLMILQTSVSSVFAPWMYRSIEKHDEKAVSSLNCRISLLLGTIILLFVLVIPDIFCMLFSEEYADAYVCIAPIALSSLFMYIYSGFVHYELYNEKPRYVMIVSSLCAILNVLLNYLFIPILDYRVCCWTTLVSYIFFALGHYIFARKVSVIKGTAFPFDVRRLALICTVHVLLICMSICIYDYWIIRYCIVFIILGLIFVFRKQILLSISTIK